MSTALPAGDTRGAKIRRTRLAADLTSRALDALAGVSQGSTAHVEAGKRHNIGDAVYTAIAVALKLDPAAVLALPVHATAPSSDLTTTEPDGEVLAFINHDLIDRSDINPRRSFDTEALTTLADSIAEHGLVQPIMLRPRDDAPGRYWIVVGERRWRAVGLLLATGRAGGSFDLPARIRRMSDREHREIALVENMHRKDVEPLEEAEGIAQLVADYGGDTAAAAAAIGKTGRGGQRFVQIALNLVQKLTPEVQDAMRTGTVNKEMARQLTTASPSRQVEVLARITTGHLRTGKDVKNALHAGSFPARDALFGRLEYNGDVLVDEDSGEVYFTDTKLVRELQIAAIKAKARELRESNIPVVKEITDNGHWHPNCHWAEMEGYRQTPATAKLPAGHQRAAALVLKYDLSVQIFTDLSKGPPPATTTAGKKAEAKANGDVLADFPTGAKLFARRARTMALQRALYEEVGHPTLLAHFCLTLLGGMGEGDDMLAVRAEHRPPDKRAIDPEVKAIITEFRVALEFETGEKLFIDMDDNDPYLRIRSEPLGQYSSTRSRIAGIVLERLYGLGHTGLYQLAMALLAARAGTWWGNGSNGEPDIGDKPETLSACQKLNLTAAEAPLHGGAWLAKLTGPHLDVLARHVQLQRKDEAPTWREATATDKRKILDRWLTDRPDKAAFVPAIFRFGDSKDIDAAMRAEITGTPPAKIAAE